MYIYFIIFYLFILTNNQMLKAFVFSDRQTERTTERERERERERVEGTDAVLNVCIVFSNK